MKGHVNCLAFNVAPDNFFVFPQRRHYTPHRWVPGPSHIHLQGSKCMSAHRFGKILVHHTLYRSPHAEPTWSLVNAPGPHSHCVKEVHCLNSTERGAETESSSELPKHTQYAGDGAGI